MGITCGYNLSKAETDPPSSMTHQLYGGVKPIKIWVVFLGQLAAYKVPSTIVPSMISGWNFYPPRGHPLGREHDDKPWLNNDWLVVLTILKNISQWEGLSHILWKIKMFETTNQIKFGGTLLFGQTRITDLWWECWDENRWPSECSGYMWVWSVSLNTNYGAFW